MNEYEKEKISLKKETSVNLNVIFGPCEAYHRQWWFDPVRGRENRWSPKVLLVRNFEHGRTEAVWNMLNSCFNFFHSLSLICKKKKPFKLQQILTY